VLNLVGGCGHEIRMESISHVKILNHCCHAQRVDRDRLVDLQDVSGRSQSYLVKKITIYDFSKTHSGSKLVTFAKVLGLINHHLIDDNYA
jgi:hypothetical protein